MQEPTCGRRSFIGASIATVLVGTGRRGRAAPVVSSDGFTVIEAAAGRSPVAGEANEVWQFAGSVPGSSVRIALGDELKVRLVNRLTTPLSLHWQGIRIVNSADGVAGLTQVPVAPGGSFDYRFTPPDSGTFLFHPVVPGAPPGPPGCGLYGVLVVDEPQSPAVDHEVQVAATSWRVDAAGRLVDPAASGRTILARGTRIEAETLTVAQGSRLRVRAVNASAAMPILLAIDGARPSVIAVDSQPCEPFAPARGIVPIGPGARFDLILDMPRQRGAQVRAMLRDGLDPDDEGKAILVIRTGSDRAPERSAPAALPENPRLPTAIALERAVRAELILRPPPPGATPRRAGRSRGPADRILTPGLDTRVPALSVKRGTPVAFALVNPSLQPMSVHVHGHALRVLHDLDDGWHPYWRDTVLMEPRKTHHVAFVADNPGKWLVSARMLGTAEPFYTWFDVG